MYGISGKDLSILYTVVGNQSLDRLVGLGLGATGDMNLDGVGDFATVDKLYSAAYSYFLSVRSGVDGSLIYSAPVAVDTRWVTSVGDQNGDGVPELVVGPVVGGMSVRDGATGLGLQLLMSTMSGYGAAGIEPLGDLNGDGLQDIAILTASGNLTTSVDVLVSSSAGGGFSSVTTFTGGGGDVRIARAADLDGDGLDDYFVRVASLFCGGTSIANVLEARSGLTHAVIWSVPSPPGFTFYLGGRGNLVTMKDVDGDGLDDVAVMAIQASPANGNSPVKVVVYAGSDGGLISQATLDPLVGYNCSAVPIYFNHHWRVTSGDFDGDGLADLAVPNPFANSGFGEVEIYRGTTVFDPMAARGNVVAANGTGFVDVLGVNAAGAGSGSPGGPPRSVFLSPGTNLGIWLESAPGTGPAPSSYAVFGRVISGADHGTFPLPLGVGSMCFAPEFLDPFGGDPLFTLLNTFGG